MYYLKEEKEKKKKKDTIEISGIYILESHPLCTPAAQTETSLRINWLVSIWFTRI